jgi:hypothetical protein
MDQVSLFFAFYSLILGLAITEVLGGFGRFVRSHATHKLGAQTALLAIFTFVSITASWIDSFQTLRSIQLDVESLWAPILTATSYYLAATVVFPSSANDLDHLDEYFTGRKRFAVGFLFVCEMLVTYTFRNIIYQDAQEHPQAFMYFYLPFHIILKGSYIALFFSRSKRANIFWLSVLILLLLFIYWDHGTIAQMIDKAYAPA